MKIGPYKVIEVEESGAIVCETDYPTTNDSGTEGKRIRFPPYHEYSKYVAERLEREKDASKLQPEMCVDLTVQRGRGDQ